MVFQIDTTATIRYNLSDNDLGKWCFLINGQPVGFYRSRREAENVFGHTL